MDYIHVKNIEHYQPNYKDGRRLIWIRWEIDSITDSGFFLLSPAQKWLFIGLTMLETKEQKPIPWNESWLSLSLNYPKSSIHNDLLMLQENDLLVTKCDKMSPTESTENTENTESTEIYVDFEKSTLTAWNEFCGKYPTLKKITSVSGTRRTHLKKRFGEKAFKFAEILVAVGEQKFLINGNPSSANHKHWRVGFDWLIANDTNYLKVLERNYLDGTATNGIYRTT